MEFFFTVFDLMKLILNLNLSLKKILQVFGPFCVFCQFFTSWTRIQKMSHNLDPNGS